MSNAQKEVQGSKPVYQVKLEKDVCVPMRDGVRLSVDIFRPDAEGKFPALLAYGQYGKELEEMGLHIPSPGPAQPALGRGHRGRRYALHCVSWIRACRRGRPGDG